MSITGAKKPPKANYDRLDQSDNSAQCGYVNDGVQGGDGVSWSEDQRYIIEDGRNYSHDDGYDDEGNDLNPDFHQTEARNALNMRIVSKDMRRNSKLTKDTASARLVARFRRCFRIPILMSVLILFSCYVVVYHNRVAWPLSMHGPVQRVGSLEDSPRTEEEKKDQKQGAQQKVSEVGQQLESGIPKESQLRGNEASIRKDGSENDKSKPIVKDGMSTLALEKSKAESRNSESSGAKTKSKEGEAVAKTKYSEGGESKNGD